jgi:pyrroloquinoline quinone biosynthesis protein B
VKVRVLGTAAGGGWPQWNCACQGCPTARERRLQRTQDCVAVSGDGRVWYLLNASPDLRGQLLAAPDLTPGPGRRDTPVRGVLLTTAELDHTIGLLSLREATGIEVYASAAVTAALTTGFPIRPMLAGYTTVDWHLLTAGEPVSLAGGLDAQAIPVGAKRPRYAPAEAADDWVVALRITDRRTGGVLLYAPCLPAWPEPLAEAISGADQILLDGTFLTDDELVRAGLSATVLGHLPIVRTLALLPAGAARRCLYTHLNNTNPVAVPGVVEAQRLWPAAVADDGQVLTL